MSLVSLSVSPATGTTSSRTLSIELVLLVAIYVHLIQQ